MKKEKNSDARFAAVITSPTSRNVPSITAESTLKKESLNRLLISESCAENADFRYALTSKLTYTELKMLIAPKMKPEVSLSYDGPK